MNEGILSTVGRTPLIRLSRIYADIPFRLFAKLESTNPGGSVKDRPALSILKHAMETGAVTPGTVVVESSSGNMGVGLAQACAFHGLRFICVVDTRTTPQNIRLLETYGAEVDMVTEPDPQTGDLLEARIKRVRALLDTIGNSFWPDQYSNIYNPIAHRQLMREIVTSCDGPVDYLFCATSTCGTVRGCAEFIREQGLPTKVIAVDAVGSVIFGGQRGKRLIPGYGAGRRSELFQEGLVEECVHVTDLECVVGCHRLVRREAILAGGSSGAIIMAVGRIKDKIPAGANCVVIFPDRGERYLDTIYSKEWIAEHFGEASHLWQDELK